MGSVFSLTQQQIRFFSLFGYLRLPGLLIDEIAAITTEFERVFEDYQDEIVNWIHETHENLPRQFISSFIDKNEQLQRLKEHPAIKSINNALLGDGYSYVGSDGNFFSCGTKWHHDAYGANMKLKHIKYGIYLDEIDGNSGALRFLPGSHLAGESFANSTRNLLENPESKLGVRDDEVPAVVYPNTPGDVLVWDYRIMHATCYAGNVRRLIAMDFSETK